MTKEELNIIDKSSELMNLFVALPVFHCADRRDVAFHIHAIRSIVMQREAVRAHPDVFRCEANEPEANKG